MMTLLIGNRRKPNRSPKNSQAGIALLEVLVSVAIISGGLLAVYQPLFASLSGLHDAEHRLIANRLVGNRLWEIQEEAARTGRFPVLVSNPVLTRGDKVFYYGVSHRPLGADKGLYQVDAAVAWQSGSRRKNITRSIYVRF